ncbi:unnamed protein product [Rotaria socialis]|uniref:Uncharacterized protein n=1 Tax=Rotaria socialis TaxID=392032 RepID=A0A817VSW6_9BILA|nr:unnamed protein product [Rotaria socialis]CAF4432801.1 unnamed protein product [Rotaria socialis]
MRIIGISVEFPFNSEMKQVHLALLLCLLLAISATGQYHSANVLGHRLAEQQLDVGQTDLSGYAVFSDPNSFANYGQQSNSRLPSSSRTNNVPRVNKEVSPSGPNFQGTQRDQTFDNNNNVGQLTIDNNNKHVRPYAEPTGPPFGIQSTGYVLSYPEEKLDLSKCGPKPTTNPCKISGPQYHALSGYPHCYIHCSFGRVFIKPCPIDLVWNTRINSCDWPTIGSTVDNDDNSAIYYDSRNTNYEHLYGRKKRSTTERKKRCLGGYEGSYQCSLPRYASQQLRIPLTSYNLPGPVSFPGQVGFAGVPSQFAGSQSHSQAMAQPAAPTLSAPTSFVSGLSSPISFGQTPTTYDPNAQARAYSQFSGLYADSYGIAARNVQAAPPTDQVTAPVAPATVPAVPTTTTNGLQAPPTFFPGFFPPTFFPQQYAAPVNPFVTRTPTPLEVTLIPGPFYPYGPPHGGPFGGPMPPTPKKPSIEDYFKRYRYFGGHHPFSHGFSQSPIHSSSIVSGGQPFSSSRSFVGQHVPTGFSYGGQYTPPSSLFDSQSVPNDFLYGGQKFQSFLPVNSQQYPTAMPYGGRPFPPFRKVNIPIRGSFGGKQSTNGEAHPVLGFDLFMSDDGLYAEEIDGDTLTKGKDKNTGKGNKNNAKASDNKNSEKSNSKNNEGDNNESPSRKKRQYDASATTVGQVPSVGGTEKQQYPASFNPFRVGSHNAVQQSHLNSNQYLRPSISRLSPCVGKSLGSNTAHPRDDTKYIACLNQFYYETMNCPSGLIYNAATDRCEKRKNPDAICDREQPCMNGGQCYQTGKTAYKCTCNGAWTGERCETQLSSCATNPCGPGNICQTLKTGDYKQDYVCVCNENQSYGPSCGQNTVPNPCLTTTTIPEPYHPFEFSAQAFIQCNGDFLYVQPCAPGLIWNKNEQVCDRLETTSYEGVYASNEQKLLSDNFGPIFADRISVQPQADQQRAILIQHNQQELPTLTDRSSSSIPVVQTQTVDTYVKRPLYDDVYYEPPHTEVMSQQPLQPVTRFRTKLPKNINMQ